MQTFESASTLLAELKATHAAMTANNNNNTTKVRFHVSHKNSQRGTVCGSAVFDTATNALQFTSGQGTAVLFKSFEEFAKSTAFAPGDTKWRVAISKIDTQPFRLAHVGVQVQVTYYNGIERFRRDLKQDAWPEHWTILEVVTGNALVVKASLSVTAEDNVNCYTRAWNVLGKIMDDAIQKILQPDTRKHSLNFRETFRTPDEWKTWVYFKVAENTKGLPSPLGLIPLAERWATTVFRVKETAQNDSTMEMKYALFHAACRSCNIVGDFAKLVFSLVDSQLESRDKLSATIYNNLKETLFSGKEVSIHLGYALHLHRKATYSSSSADITCKFDKDICAVLNQAIADSQDAIKKTKHQESIKSAYGKYLTDAIFEFKKQFVGAFLSDNQLSANELLARYVQLIVTEKQVTDRLGLNFNESASAVIKGVLNDARTLTKLLDESLKSTISDLHEKQISLFSSFFLGAHVDPDHIRVIFKLVGAFPEGIHASRATFKPHLEKLFPDLGTLLPAEPIFEKTIEVADLFRFNVAKFISLEALFQNRGNAGDTAPGRQLPAGDAQSWGHVDQLLTSNVGTTGDSFQYSDAGALMLLKETWSERVKVAFASDERGNGEAMVALLIDEICTNDEHVDRFDLLKFAASRLASQARNKDRLESEIKAKFARRILMSETGEFNERQEAMINIIKNMEGSRFTGQLEHMQADMRASAALRDKFDETQRNADPNAVHTLRAKVLTQFAWPTTVAGGVVQQLLPHALVQLRERFVTWYGTKHGQHRLNWSNNELFTYASVRLTASGFAGLKLELPIAAAALILKAIEQGSVSLTDPLAEAAYSILSKARIMGKNKSGDVTVAPTSHLEKIGRRSISLLPKQKAAAVQDVSQEASRRDTDFVIHAAIVRVMKTKKSSNHNDLFSKVSEVLRPRFEVVIAQFKSCIEHLIEKEYIRRDTEDRSKYHYMA